MQLLLSLCVGIGLSATCGLRVFLPFLGISIAARSGHLTLAEGFLWIGSTPALLAFGIATVVEIASYYIPWLDNLLDSVMSVAAVAAGTIVTASMVGDVSPFLQWSLAAIAGGGSAGVFQAATVVARGASTVTTGGLGNPVVSTLEWVGALVGIILAILLPVVAALIVVLVLFFLVRRIVRWRRKRKMRSGKPENPQSAERDIPSEIERLAALRDKGSLTEEEFSAKKADLLARI